MAIPLTIKNNSGIDTSLIWVTVLGLDVTTNLAVAGNPDGSTTLIKNCETVTQFAQPLSAWTDAILPSLSSGRIYFSYINKLEGAPFQNQGQADQQIPFPTINNWQDSCYYTLFDFVEFTLWDDTSKPSCFNTTYVDKFAMPMNLTLKGGINGTQTIGVWTQDRSNVFDQIEAAGETFSDQIVSYNGNYIRAISPTTSVTTQPGFGPIFPLDFYETYVNQCWTFFSNPNNKLVLSNIANSTSGPLVAEGNVASDNTFTFIIYDNFRTVWGTHKIAKPSTYDILGCDGTLFAPSDNVGGNINKQFGAMLNRSNLLQNLPPGDTCSPKPEQCCTITFYQGDATNKYVQILHENVEDQNVYAFPFDDVCNYSSTVCDNEPEAFSIELQSFGQFIKPAKIIEGPYAKYICSGSQTTFTVIAEGASNTYQWQSAPPIPPGKNQNDLSFSNIEGATSADYTDTFDLTKSGFYFRCIVDNQYYSKNAQLTVYPVSKIVQPPPRNVGGTSGFPISISFTADQVVQAVWQKNGKPLPDTPKYTSIIDFTSQPNKVTLIIKDLERSDQGNYSCILNGIYTFCCSEASPGNTQLVITSTPEDGDIVETSAGSSVSLRSKAPEGQHQWEMKKPEIDTFIPIPGANQPILYIENVRRTMHGNMYRAIVTTGDSVIAHPPTKLLVYHCHNVCTRHQIDWC